VDAMTRTKVALCIALLFPIISLITLTFYKKHLLETGYEVVLPVSGYDPRDLLSGHYIIYTVDYGVSNLCRNSAYLEEGYVCLDNKTFSFEKNPVCKLVIRGTCSGGRFEAGIEKFYIPEDKAEILDKKVRGKKASILISISPTGQAQVKDLLIEGKSWQQQ
jgi:uncharacterized membrane-anchored protein